MSTMLDAAFPYADAGWRVFFVSKKKVPLKGSHSFKEASSNRAELTALYDRYVTNHRCNLALATGDLVVLDADGPGGLKTLLGLAAPHATSESPSGLPDTLVSQTPRGGLHFVYRAPAGKYLSGWNEKRPRGADGLDVKAHGGLILIEPSTVRGLPYRWVHRVPIAELPTWAVEWIEQHRGHQAPLVPATLGERPAYLSGAVDLTSQALELVGVMPWSAAEEARLRAALWFIPTETLGYDDFLAIGFALHSSKWFNQNSEPIGLIIWHEWAKTTPHYNPAGLDKKWESFERSTYTGRKIGLGRIYKMAQDAGWDGTVPYPAPKPEVLVELPKQTNGNHSVFAESAGGVAPIIFPDREKGGKPKATCRNARAAIIGLGISCQHDLFHNKMLLGGRLIDQWAGELSDDATQMLRVVIERNFGFDPSLQHAHDAAVQECLLRPFDPVVRYLDDVTWDGRPRVATWLTTYMGATDSAFCRATGTLALAAAVRRAREPGTKFDQIIVLESPEGRGKSTAIEILAGADNFSDQLILTLDDKGQQEAVQGVWLYEIGDLAGMGRADVERVKAFASRKVDRARPAYGRTRVDRPRRCVFFATTNDDAYLLSQTGNRRFWPVRIGRIDLDGLARDRDQLWAEAAQIERCGMSLMLPESLWSGASVEQEARQIQDGWMDVLDNVTGKLIEGEYRVTTYELYSAHLELGSDRISPVISKRLGYVMRRLGWHGPKTFKNENNTPVRGYVRPEGWKRDGLL